MRELYLPNFDFGFICYLLVLGVHFLWALYILWKKLAPLGIGPIQHPVFILVGLLLLNAPSIFVFVEGSFLHSVLGAQANMFYHILLTVDEVVRVRRYPVRGVFLVNHIYWAALFFNYWQNGEFSHSENVSTVPVEFLGHLISWIWA